MLYFDIWTHWAGLEQVSRKLPHGRNCKLQVYSVMIILCWQALRRTRQGFAVAMNKVCHDVGLRKQHVGYHNSWVCWCLILLVWFWVLHCGDVGSAY